MIVLTADTGATQHCWGQQAVQSGAVYDWEELSDPVTLVTADKDTTTITHAGKVDVDGHTYWGYIVPGCPHNLWSVSEMCEEGWEYRQRCDKAGKANPLGTPGAPVRPQ